MWSLTLAVLAASLPQSPPKWRHFELESGVRVSVLVVEKALRQTTFTFLPLGLSNDESGCAQFSHLVEHMLIRSTHPRGFGDQGLRFNGETTGSSLRLETMAVPDRADAAFAMHAGWLTSRNYRDEVLTREKKNIANEVEQTERNGYVHKWSIAAWAQVAGHGRKHAAVRGDVAETKLPAVRDYVGRHVVVGPRVRIVTGGPIPFDRVREQLEKLFPAAGAPPSSKAIGSAANRESPEVPERATWDLSRRQRLVWYELPGRTAEERLAQGAIAQQVMMRLYRGRTLSKGRALASIETLANGKRYLVLSAKVPEEADLSSIDAALDRAIADIAKRPFPGLVRQYIRSIREVPDIERQRRRFEGKPIATMIEANILLRAATHELVSGVPLEKLPKAVAGVTVELVAEVAKRLTSERRKRLLLTPR